MSIFRSSAASVNQGQTVITCTDNVDFSSLTQGSMVVIQGNKFLIASGGTAPIGGTSTIILDEAYPATFPNVSNVDVTVVVGYASVIAAVESAKLVSNNLTTTKAALQAIIDAQGTAATKDVGTGSGNVMEVGAFGIGLTDAQAYPRASLNDVSGLPASKYGGYLASISTANGWPIDATAVNYTLQHHVERENSGTQILEFQRINSVTANRVFVRSCYSNTFTPWVEIYNSGNTNFNEFGSEGAADIIATGYRRNDTLIRFALPINSPTPPTSISVVGTFDVYDTETQTEIVAGVVPTLNVGASSCKLAIVDVPVPSSTTKSGFQLQTDTSASKITVNF